MEGVNLNRGNNKDYNNPLVLDIMRVNSENHNQYDLPFYYLGQIMQTSFKYLFFKQIFFNDNILPS